MTLEIRPHHPSFLPPSREVVAYQRQQRLRRWSIIINLMTFLVVTVPSVIIDFNDQSAAWSQWVVSGAAVTAAIYAAVIERSRLRGWLLQRQFNRPSYQCNTNAR
jgi:hypothetical protein